MVYSSFDKSTEIYGGIIVGFRKSINQQSFSHILSRYGLDQAKEHEWYLLQDWLNVLNDIAAAGDSMFDFVSIGLALGEQFSIDSPEYQGKSVAQILQLSIGNSLQQYFRNGNAGWVNVKQVSEKHIRLEIQMPVPSDLLYGKVYGTSRILLKTSFTLSYDEGSVLPEKGGEAAVMHLTW